MTTYIAVPHWLSVKHLLITHLIRNVDDAFFPMSSERLLPDALPNDFPHQTSTLF